MSSLRSGHRLAGLHLQKTPFGRGRGMWPARRPRTRTGTTRHGVQAYQRHPGHLGAGGLVAYAHHDHPCRHDAGNHRHAVAQPLLLHAEAPDGRTAGGDSRGQLAFGAVPHQLYRRERLRVERGLLTIVPGGDGEDSGLIFRHHLSDLSTDRGDGAPALLDAGREDHDEDLHRAARFVVQRMVDVSTH